MERNKVFASQPQDRKQHLQLTARQGPAARHRQEQGDVLVAVGKRMKANR